MIPHGAIGNPPYNDGTVARNPIYGEFLANFAKQKPDYLFKVIPANWFSQPESKLGKSVRASLRKLGVYKITLNPYDTFTTAKVKTCTVFCRKGHSGDIVLVDSESNKHAIIKDFDSQILYTADQNELDLLYSLKPFQPWTTHEGSKVDQQKWRVATSYRKENFEITPLNPLKVLEPYYKSESGYRVFSGFTTEQEAVAAQEQYQSFWHSKLVFWILKKTRTSTTLDNPQIAWVPRIKIDRIFTDIDLYTAFNLTDDQISMIESQ
jgi:hypothetical protein